MAVAVSCERLSVRYGDVVALDDISLNFEVGMIHALVGQNGAGKTTLARTIAGIVSPAGGSVSAHGQGLPPGDARAARDRGIGMVHQSFALPPSMTVAEALEFGSTRRSRRGFSRRGLNARWQAYLDGMGLNLRATERVRSLSVETLQGLEIARALADDAQILILDEPTAVLSPEGVQLLFERLRQLSSAGVTVIVVLHKIREVLAIAQRVNVLRSGKLVLEDVAADRLSPDRIAEAIIGTAVQAEPILSLEDEAAAVGIRRDSSHPLRSRQAGERLVAFEGVSSLQRGAQAGLRTVNLSLNSHEIVGIAGVDGNGQIALVETLGGIEPVIEGRLTMDGRDITRASTVARRRQGLRIIPFDRNVEGLSASSQLWQNWAISHLIMRAGGLFISPRRLKEHARAAFDAWDVHFHSVTQRGSELSGGNAQKVILARELGDEGRVIVAAQPTRGLDLGAVAFVWSALRTARDGGAGVVLVSSDLDELFDLSDRILVMLAGEIVLEAERPFDLVQIGAAMTGADT